MGKYYYYVANIYKDDRLGIINGASQFTRDFSISLIMESIGKDYKIEAKNVIITFFVEISKEEFNHFKTLLNNKD